jgi:hypothetical protein
MMIRSPGCIDAAARLKYVTCKASMSDPSWKSVPMSHQWQGNRNAK